MPYERNWGSTHPGCLIVLIDQSFSMRHPLGGNQIGVGKRKCDMVATSVNNLIYDLILTNTVGTNIRSCADVALLGYGSREGDVRFVLPKPLSHYSFVSLSELRKYPVRIETRMRREMDDVGDIVEVPDFFPVWIDPVAENGKPTCAALSQARRLANDWAHHHPENYPPIVVHITDGAAGDGDPTGIADELCRVSTNDGNVLLFNCHISESMEPEVLFPNSDVNLRDPLVKKLFAMSSIIPDTARLNLMDIGLIVASDARGFIFNGDANAIRSMFSFATKTARWTIDPSR